MTPAPAIPLRPSGRPGPAPSGPAGRRPPKRRGDSRRPTDRLLRHASMIARLVLDIERGLRPQRQLEHCATEELRSRLAGLRGRPCRAAAPAPVLRTVRGVRTAADRFDAVALVQRGTRLTSIGLGLVRREGRWALDELARLDGPTLPPPAYPLPCDHLDAFELAAGET